MNTSTTLKGILFLGFSNTQGLKETLNEVDDLICNHEELNLKDLRSLYPDIQFSLSKFELDPDLEIREIMISNVIWVGFDDQMEKNTIQNTIIDIQNWFDNKESNINGSELISELKADSAFAHLEFSLTKPTELTNFLEIEII